MKRLIISIILMANVHLCYSQEIIKLQFDSKEKEFSPNTKSIKFKSGKIYQIKIYDVNTSFISSKLDTKSYILSSSTPEIIKPIYPGISDEYSVYELFQIPESLDPLNEVYLRAVEKYNNLKGLKANSDYLYNCSLININNIKADSIKNNVLGIFKVDSILELKREVNLSIKYLEVAKEVFTVKIKKIETGELIDNYVIVNYAEICYMYDLIKSDNFLRYINFIENSIKPVEPITSKPFKAEKDIVDLKVLLIDNYKSDTIYNSDLSFYTSGNLSFDFSTGFFYNNLHEDSYYIEKRDTLINNVIKNDDMNFDVSFGALGHLSYKFKSNIRLGASMGAALSPLDGKMRYLVGGSLLFGREKQVGIDAGWVFAKMKVLSNSVKSDIIGYYVAANVTSVPTYDKIVKGFYVGLTYNLTSKKK